MGDVPLVSVNFGEGQLRLELSRLGAFKLLCRGEYVPLIGIGIKGIYLVKQDGERHGHSLREGALGSILLVVKATVLLYGCGSLREHRP